ASLVEPACVAIALARVLANLGMAPALVGDRQVVENFDHRRTVDSHPVECLVPLGEVWGHKILRLENGGDGACVEGAPAPQRGYPFDRRRRLGVPSLARIVAQRRQRHAYPRSAGRIVGKEATFNPTRAWR